MAIPETDLDRIQLWCREQWAENMWDKVKCEADISGHRVDIVEVRRMWDGPGTGDREPIRESVARLRYTATTGLWAIYWCDRNLKFHEYKFKRPSKNVQPLLDHIADSGDPIFWG